MGKASDDLYHLNGKQTMQNRISWCNPLKLHQLGSKKLENIEISSALKPECMFNVKHNQQIYGLFQTET